MRNSLFLLCLILLVSCDRNDAHKGKDSRAQQEKVVLNGLVKYYDVQNRLSSEVTYKDGMRHGITRIYYASGSISDEIMYQWGEKTGFAKKFHKNGRIYSLTPYVDGVKHGIQKKYYSNGALWAETPYSHGQPGIGLVEYDRFGDARTIFPRIEIQQFNRRGKISLNFFLSNHSKNVLFYHSDLVEEKYLPQKISRLVSEGGVGKMEIPVKHGVVLDTLLSIVAKYRTLDHNIYITRRYYRVRVTP